VTVAGLGAVLGLAGATLGRLLMVFLGNRLSATATALQMLPRPWGTGAADAARRRSDRRSVAFFDAALGTPAVVLSIWLLVGLALVAVGRTPGRAAPRAADPAFAPVRGRGADAHPRLVSDLVITCMPARNRPPATSNS
jgi:hypothetical protein